MINNLFDEIKKGKLRVVVSPNKRQSKLVSYDEDKGVFRVEISQPAKDDKANKELARFFKKEFNLRVHIISGGTNREKILLVDK